MVGINKLLLPEGASLCLLVQLPHGGGMEMEGSAL